jgi:hypothetical protein
MISCRLDGSEEHPARERRYIPAAEFELWRHFMETRHGRVVTVDDVSVWVPEAPEASLDPAIHAAIDADVLLPVRRVSFEQSNLQGIVVPVVRFFPNETYPEAKEALLKHFDRQCRRSVQETPGYFLAVA